MKNNIVLGAALVVVLFIAVLLPQHYAWSAGGTYSSATTYAGDYTTDMVFYSSSNGQFWRRVPNLYRVDRIKCQDAVDHLRRDGMWKGHLKSDGSCDAYDEPDLWATGNWLNYQETETGSGR